MLSSAERAPRSIDRQFLSLNPFESTFRYPIDIITADQFPQRADHSRLKEHVEPASLMAVKPAAGKVGNDRMKRIMQEVGIKNHFLTTFPTDLQRVDQGIGGRPTSKY
jgi:hypothetical protein